MSNGSLENNFLYKILTILHAILLQKCMEKQYRLKPQAYMRFHFNVAHYITNFSKLTICVQKALKPAWQTHQIIKREIIKR